MATVILSIVTLVWAAMFILPLIAYTALGVRLLKDVFTHGDTAARRHEGRKPTFVPSFTH